MATRPVWHPGRGKFAKLLILKAMSDLKLLDGCLMAGHSKAREGAWMSTDTNEKGLEARTLPHLTGRDGQALGALGRAALVGLLDRYLRGLLDPFVSLLEAHKLMYFMQEAGQPLRLNYKPAFYGPYAENLRHVLREVEGHFLTGYADGGDAPDQQLQLVPGAASDAEAMLAADADTRARFDRVASLVEGFETPFGLELLATVHWVMTRNRVDGLEEVIQRTYAWNERKRQFTPRQIGIAVDCLRRQGWVSGFARPADIPS